MHNFSWSGSFVGKRKKSGKASWTDFCSEWVTKEMQEGFQAAAGCTDVTRRSGRRVLEEQRFFRKFPLHSTTQLSLDWWSMILPVPANHLIL